MKLYLFLCFYFASQLYISKNNIYWSHDRKLRIDDFQFVDADTFNSAYAAMTYSSINIQYAVDSGKLRYNIQAYFDKDSSWMKRINNTLSNSDIYISYQIKKGLSHEQKHFDITEVYARKMRKFLAKCNLNDTDLISSKINNLYDSLAGYQRTYDVETIFSQDSIAQNK